MGTLSLQAFIAKEVANKVSIIPQAFFAKEMAFCKLALLAFFHAAAILASKKGS